MAITLRAARVNAGYNQEQAAAKIGVTRDVISNWERGKTYPSVKYLPLIENAYGLKYDQIIFMQKGNA